MLGSKNDHTQVPPAWSDDLNPATNTRIQRSLESLGEEPAAWKRAYEAARQAAWRVLAASSTHLTAARDRAAAGLAEAESRAERLPTSANRNDVLSCRNRLRIAEEILAAAPGEAERLRVAAERQQRKVALRDATKETLHLLVDIDGRPLVEAVVTDDAAVEAERAACQALQAEADRLKAAAIETLGDALDKSLMHEVRAVAALLRGRGLAIARLYPSLADGGIVRAFRRAHDLARLSAELDGKAIDVDQTFAAGLDEEQFAAFAAIVYPPVNRFLSWVGSRR